MSVIFFFAALGLVSVIVSILAASLVIAAPLYDRLGFVPTGEVE